VDASSYALVHGVKTTRATLSEWNGRPWTVVGSWLLGSLAAAGVLLLAVLALSEIVPGSGLVSLHRPPLGVGNPSDVVQIFVRNSLVLALHAMACVAGFMAGSSLPMQARTQTGFSRFIHERGARFAILFVCAATIFSLSAQAWVLGSEVAGVARGLNVSPALLLVGLLPHAVPELTALFLPLAAWIIASRRGDWDKLLAATVVTVSIAVPTLVVTALWEVYVAPHLVRPLVLHHLLTTVVVR
jgi:Stage II sporulation protein M